MLIVTDIQCKLLPCLQSHKYVNNQRKETRYSKKLKNDRGTSSIEQDIDRQYIVVKRLFT